MRTHTDKDGVHWHEDADGRWWAGCQVLPRNGGEMNHEEPCCGNCVAYHRREDVLTGEPEKSGWCGITRPNREYPPEHVCSYHIFKTAKNAITRRTG